MADTPGRWAVGGGTSHGIVADRRRRGERLVVLAVCWALAGGATGPARAATDTAGRWNAFLVFENDALWIDDSDRHYTNGIQLGVHLAEGNAWPWLAGLARRTVARGDGTLLFQRLAVGQNLFTPENLKTDELVADDRPYAGWLHADLGVTGRRGRDLAVLELSLGLVGPSAGGEALQKWFHELIDSPDPLGWEHQLRDELAVLLVAQRSWGGLAPPRRLPGLGGLAWDAVPHLDVNLGNVFTHLGGGLTVRLGSRLEGDHGPLRMRPSPVGAAPPDGDRRLRGYVFGGLGGRWVLRNIFLDGNTFVPSHSVDKLPLVGEALVGAAVAWQGVLVSFTHTLRSPEFAGQRRPDHFGSFALTVTP